ncbi:MAG TPA: hypothetical protein IAC25_08675 [Candidatus Enterenecus stercoripullorum]|nr:hypothetical protein [Candidatus Enterenecus stercoripullorum]
MSDLEEKLEGILSNPKAMEQIMSLAQSLGKSSAQSQSPASDTQPQPEPETAPASEPSDSGLLGTLSQIDPRLISGAVQLMSQYQSNDDGRVALLNALRPFVKEKRYAKLDKAIQIAKLSRLIRMGLELLRPREDPHV